MDATALAALQADADVAALEREMEEITGEVQETQNHEGETQILGDLDVEQQDGQTIKKEGDKFILADGDGGGNENGEEGEPLVYYLVEENDGGSALVMHSHGGRRQSSEQEESDADTQGLEDYEMKSQEKEGEGKEATGETSDAQVKVEPGASGSSPSHAAGDENTVDLTESKDPSEIWEENKCIICNSGMRLDNPENLVVGNAELKTFFGKMLGLGEGLQLDQELTYPFCDLCTAEVKYLKSIAHKIDFMHRQFDKLRDGLAKKMVNTFLHRKDPGLMKKEEDDKKANPNYDMDNPITMKDIIYNRWKNRYEVNFPGPKCPLVVKTVDSKGRSTILRMNSQDIKDNMDSKQVSLSRFAKGGVRDTRRVPVLKLDDGQETSGVDIIKNEYRCKDCDKSFTTSHMLAYHSRIHSGELPFECELCGKGFAVPHYLMIHMRSHTGEKPYKCDVCGKGFAQRGGLVTHNLVHSGDKPFECTECGKSFRQKYHLTQHLLIHSGAKPFGCEVCGKFFNVKMNLREHMRRHTGDRPYKCPYCLIIGFFRKKMLRDHILKSHPTKALPGELENLSETKPQVSRRPSASEGDPSSTKKMKRNVKVKVESDSEMEAEYLSPSPSPSPNPSRDEEGVTTFKMKKIVEEYINEEGKKH